MIYGFDDNKNRVEVPDANFKIVDYAYNLSVHTVSDNKLTLNVGEAIISAVYDDFTSTNYTSTIYTSVPSSRYMIITLGNEVGSWSTTIENVNSGTFNDLMINNHAVVSDNLGRFYLFPYGVSYTEGSNSGYYNVTFFRYVRYFILRIS